MYKLFNYLFGWDYIQWSNPVDQGVARVRVDYNNKCWYWQYYTTRIAKISYVDEGVISIDVKKDTYLDEGSIDELGLLLKEAYKELMK